MRVLRNEFPDNIAVFGIVGSYACLSEVGLPDKTVAGEVAVTVRLKESGIDVVFTIIQYLRIRAC